MKYRIVSLGKLKINVAQEPAIAALVSATNLPEDKVRQKLLSGKRVNILTSSNVGKIAELKGKLQQAGLIVEVVEVAPKAEEPISSPGKQKINLVRVFYRLFGTSAVAVGLFAGARLNGLL